MKAFFWSTKRLVRLYCWLILGFVVLAAAFLLLRQLDAPGWSASALVAAASVAWVAVAIRAVFAQARENARSRTDISEPSLSARRLPPDGS